MLSNKDLDMVEQLNKDIIIHKNGMAKKFRQICVLKNERLKFGREIVIAKDAIRKVLGYKKAQTEDQIKKSVETK